MIYNVTRYIDLNNEKFRIKPKPQEDELLSSWLVYNTPRNLNKFF